MEWGFRMPRRTGEARIGISGHFRRHGLASECQVPLCLYQSLNGLLLPMLTVGSGGIPTCKACRRRRVQAAYLLRAVLSVGVQYTEWDLRASSNPNLQPICLS